MKAFLLAGALGCAAQLTTGCKHDTDTAPVGYDTLAGATGHWEWDRSIYGFASPRTPASVGFTRQLVFAADGQLAVKRNGQNYYQTGYQRSVGTGGPCASPNAPVVTFTSENGLPNSDAKAYGVEQQNGQRTLYLNGAATCLDGDAYETYHWVAE
ncbi:hypothetical protein ACFQ48_03175 [Hymenobacter caeli]|uniref:Lipocalin-like domain-containing protein n=1 Tax=Hymenobacter caeli TaxID=2735894 RepID=A0ABX2FL18_9BACT|nr:hypothetical protein [Hymenobacter caeli]NRT17828.1 hypothetical protein [Hymenobacter caeli]